MQVAALCIVGSVLCVFLREVQRPQAMLLGIAIVTGALLSLMPQVQRILDTAETLWAESGLDPGYVLLLCKAAGIAYLTELGGDVCRDCGESAIASAVGLCGRVSLTLLSLPLFLRLAEIVLEVTA